MKKKKIIIVVCILFVIFFPYLKVELLTLIHGEMFECSAFPSEFPMVDDISYCKVMQYKEEKAQVLYVSKGSVTILVYYKKDNNDNWVVHDWKCVWSSTGSADGFIWPFYR